MQFMEASLMSVSNTWQSFPWTKSMKPSYTMSLAVSANRIKNHKSEQNRFRSRNAHDQLPTVDFPNTMHIDPPAQRPAHACPDKVFVDLGTDIGASGGTGEAPPGSPEVTAPADRLALPSPSGSSNLSGALCGTVAMLFLLPYCSLLNAVSVLSSAILSSLHLRSLSDPRRSAITQLLQWFSLASASTLPVLMLPFKTQSLMRRETPSLRCPLSFRATAKPFGTSRIGIWPLLLTTALFCAFVPYTHAYHDYSNANRHYYNSHKTDKDGPVLLPYHLRHHQFSGRRTSHEASSESSQAGALDDVQPEYSRSIASPSEKNHRGSSTRNHGSLRGLTRAKRTLSWRRPDAAERHPYASSSGDRYMRPEDQSGSIARLIHHKHYDEYRIDFYGPKTPMILMDRLQAIYDEADVVRRREFKAAQRRNRQYPRRGGRRYRDTVSGFGTQIPNSATGTPLVITFNQNYTEWPGPGTFEAPNAEIGVLVANFGFYEHNPGDVDPNSNYTFSIEHDSNRDHDFYIGKKDGKLRINRRLDRERVSKYLLKIAAKEESGNIGWVQMQIVILDVNDNAPYLYSTPGQCVVTENKPPNQEVCTILARDPDGPKNGPPFTMTVPDDSTMKSFFHLSFVQSLDNGNGGMIVRSLRPFDREKRKTYDVPIYVRDSGNPPQAAIRYMKITIGDVNDNPMSNGSKDVLVYSYKGQLEKASIGTVYVSDLDDWDVKDKRFAFASDKPARFDLDENNGTIYIDALTPPGQYKFDVTVTDSVRSETATGSVTVKVVFLPEDAFINSGSIRITGTTAEEFITPRNGKSKYDEMKHAIADYLGLEAADNVDIFSIMPHNGTEPPIVDIRFAAHSSPYRDAVLLNGKIDANREDFASRVGIVILQIGVDECYSGEYCGAGCWSKAEAFTAAETVNAGMVSLVGVKTKVSAVCECPKPFIPNGCSNRTCFNGGFCHPIGSDNNFSCECRGDTLKGPRCEGTTRSFSGDGYAWLKPISSCAESHISLEFIATQGSMNSVLLYNGVVDKNTPKYTNIWEKFNEMAHEWVWIGIVNGKLAVEINMGSVAGTVLLKTGPSVNDNQWHRVDILRTEQSFEVILDQCRNTKVTTGGVPDNTRCRGENATEGSERLLNLNSVMQLGGIGTDHSRLPRLNFGVTAGLDGCIRNLVVDGKLYDLQAPPLEQNTAVGCSRVNEL